MTNLTSSIQVSEEVDDGSRNLIEAAVQSSIDAGLAVNGEHGVASARHAARFVVLAMRSKDHSIAVDDVREALDELTRAVDAYATNNGGRYPTQRINNAAKKARTLSTGGRK